MSKLLQFMAISGLLSFRSLGTACITWLFFFFFLLVIDDTTKEIVYRDYVDISVAVATPRVGTLGALDMIPVASVWDGYVL